MFYYTAVKDEFMNTPKKMNSTNKEYSFDPELLNKTSLVIFQ